MVRTPAQSHDEGTNCDYEAEFVFDTWIQTALWQNVKDAAPRRAGHFRCSSLQSSKLLPIELNRKKMVPRNFTFLALAGASICCAEHPDVPLRMGSTWDARGLAR